MGSIARYIFRTTFGAFAIVLVSLTAVIWLTQALRDLDLMTSQGQTILDFIQITGLIIPQLILLISPIALVIAVSYVLNKLATDSEIIVMNGSGMSPWRLCRPFLALAAVVCALVAVFSAYVSPEGLRAFRRALVDVRADLVTYIVQPGRFVTIQNGLVFHIRERQGNGQLLGVLMDDKRDRKEHVSILAERGEIVKNDTGTFLLLQTGTVQRHISGEPEPTIVVFDRYALDLGQFATPMTINYSVKERYLWELLWPDVGDTLAKSQPAQFSAEMHDRLAAPLYPLAFVLIAFAYLGAPRTTRQSRGLSLLGTVAAVASLRFVGFASTTMAVHIPPAILLQYIALSVSIGLSAWTIGRGIIIEPPSIITNAVTALVARFAPRTATA
jgi:lipopolysaccharide export system permease protein